VAHSRRIATLEKLVQKAPAVREYRRELHIGYVWAGDQLRQQKRKAEAAEYWRKCLRMRVALVAEAPSNPEDVDHLRGALSSVADITDCPQEAVRLTEIYLEVLTKAAAEFPDVARFRSLIPEAHHKLSWQLTTTADPKLRDPVKALEHARKAVALEPKNGHWRNTLAVAYYRNGNWPEAIAELKQSTRFRPFHGLHETGYFYLAMAHWHLDEKEQARAWYDKGVAWLNKRARKGPAFGPLRAEAAELLGIPLPKLESRDAAAHNNLAWRLVMATDPRLRDPKKALAHAQKAVELEPGHEYYWDTLGIALCRDEQWKEAVAALERSMKLGDTVIVERFFFLAMAHWQLGDKKQARTWYDRGARAIRDGTPNPTQRLAQVEAATLLGIAPPDPKGKKQAPPKD
jgi:tetratricopeptide (TPR) repeat protein